MVEKRSILKVGAGGRAICLPIEFIRENRLRAGQRLYVLRNRVSLIVTTDREKALRWAKTEERAEDAAHTVHEEALEEMVVEEQETGAIKESTAGAREQP